MYRQHDVGPIKQALLESAAAGGRAVPDRRRVADRGGGRDGHADPPRPRQAGRHHPGDRVAPAVPGARGPVVYQEVAAKHMDIRDKLGSAFLDKAVDWMDTYILPASGAADRGDCRSGRASGPAGTSRPTSRSARALRRVPFSTARGPRSPIAGHP